MTKISPETAAALGSALAKVKRTSEAGTTPCFVPELLEITLIAVAEALLAPGPDDDLAARFALAKIQCESQADGIRERDDRIDELKERIDELKGAIGQAMGLLSHSIVSPEGIERAEGILRRAQGTVIP